MAIYVDRLTHFAASPLGSRKWCHMATDGDVSELHAFAIRIGIKRNWFQDGRFPHYDLTENMRRRALKAGAIDISNVDLVRLCRLKIKPTNNVAEHKDEPS